MRTVGVEEELLLVAVDASSTVAVGPGVIAESATSEAVELEHEFKQEQVEIGSSPHTELSRLTAELIRLRAAAGEAAAARGASIVAIATSPWKLSPAATRDDRYLRMVAEFGLPAREQLTCGQHVHVAVDSRAEGVAVLDRIRGWLPVLLALSANSPFWQQQDTGYASFRSVLWGRWPTAGPTDPFGDEAGYDRLIGQLIESGSALDEGMIYFDGRLSARYPTVELRVADVCTDVHDAVLLAALARALVETAARQWQAGQPAPDTPTALLRAATWRAARWGLTGTLVEPFGHRLLPAQAVLDQLQSLLAPALADSGDGQLVADGLDRIRRHGTGSQHQRTVLAAADSLAAVVRDAVTRTLAG